MRVSERAEEAFLRYILELAREEAARSQAGQGKSDEAAEEGPEGPREKG